MNGETSEVIIREPLSFVSGKEDAGKRLDVFIAEKSGLTRSSAQKLILSGNIVLNNKDATKSVCLKENDIVEVYLPEPEESEALPENIDLDIVYEDEYIIVVNKPKGMVVHPAAGNQSGTLVNALLYHCGDSLSGIGGVIRPGIVHRIDKNTSGLLIVAKTDEAHLSLSEQISTHSFLRSYEAIVCGNIKEESGTVEAPIGRHPTDRKKMAIVPSGKHAVTHYSVIERFDGFTHIKCVLETGRTHQIRVHMASKGHPILFDDVYGNLRTDFEKKNPGLSEGQCLHAKTIGFIHPISGKELYFDSELPSYFVNILDKLRKRTNK